MKKIKLIITSIIIFLIVITVGVFYFINTRNHQSPKDGIKYTEINFLPNLNKSSFDAKRNNGDEFYGLIWRPDCGDSQIFIEEFLGFFAEYNEDGSFARLKYDLENKNFFSLDVSTFIEEISDTTTRQAYSDLYGFYFTPSLVFYRDINEDGVSDVVDIAEWNPVFGFKPTDYLKWFYDHELVTANTAVVHDGKTNKKD